MHQDELFFVSFSISPFSFFNISTQFLPFFPRNSLSKYDFNSFPPKAVS